MAESSPEKLAKSLLRSSKKRHAIIVFGNEHPLVYEALRQCREANVPVITLVTDLPGAQRLCHVGIDQQQAGRTAGMMMGLMAHQPGEVLMLCGRQDFSAHRSRIQGFREVISQRFPHLQLGEVLAGEDNRQRIDRLLEEALNRNRDAVGIYNTGLGNSLVAQALARHRRYGKCCWITHERYSTTREQLAQGGMALTVDQNPHQHARLAVELALRHLETGYQPHLFRDGKVEFILYSAENVD